MAEVVVEQFSFEASSNYFGILFALTVLVSFVLGLMFISAGNHIYSSSIKSVIEGIGWGIVFLGVIAVLYAVFAVPQLTANSSQKTKITNAQKISQELTTESGYAFLTVETRIKMIKNHLISDNMVCNDNAENSEATVLAIDENNVIAEQMILSFTVDETNSSCSYVLSSFDKS